MWFAKKQEIIKEGTFTIEDPSKVKDFLSPQEIFRVARFYLRAYGQFPPSQNLTISFSEKKDSAKLRLISQISLIGIIILLISTLFFLGGSIIEGLGVYLFGSFLIVAWVVENRDLLLKTKSGAFNKNSLRIRIFTKMIENRESVYNTLIHELDHFLWHLEHGGGFDISLPYKERPHEARAFKRAELWTQDLVT